MRPGYSYGLSELEATAHNAAVGASGASEVSSPGLIAKARIIASGAIAAFLGLLPHILHHVGPLAGAAIFAGVGGSLLFGAIGFVAAIPFLVRMHRHCGNWRRPAAVLGLMAVVFSISTFVIGPAINGGGENSASESPSDQRAPSAPAEAPEQSGGGHAAHHD